MYISYVYIYTQHTFVYTYIYIYIYILESSARFARAMAYGIILQDYIKGLHYRIILWDNITG